MRSRPCPLLQLALCPLALAASLALVPLSSAAEAGPLHWQPSALWGADVRSLVLAPDRPDTAFAGTSGGQVYLSRDGGANWVDPAAGQPFAGWVVSALRFDPNRPQRLWAGLWGLWGGGLLAFSEDDGSSWAFRTTPKDGGQVYSLALVPGRTGRILIGTRQGVFASQDDGLTWTHLTRKLPEVQKVTSLLVDPDRPRTLYAGTWRRAYRSDDDGASWKGLFEGMELDREVFSLTPTPGRPGELWASTCGWVYKGSDRGARWTPSRKGLAVNRTPSFAALGDGALLAGTVGGLFRSSDGGASWSRLGPEGLAVLAIAGHPSRPKRILLGTEGSGVWRSEDGGESFERSTQGMTNVTVAALATADRELLAAVNHAGPASGLYSSIDGGRSFQAQRLGLPSVLDLASAGGRIWAATEKGLYERAPDYLWGRVVEVPEERIEQVEARSGRVVVRGARGLWERLDGRFVPLSAEGLSPRSAALLGGALWVSAGDAVYLLAGGNRQRLWAPAPAGSLTALADRMLLAGAGAAWDRRGSDGKWQRLANEEVELLATGDRRFSHLKVSREGAELFDEALGTYQPLELPVPANQLSSALLVGDRFLLGTTASGLWLAELPRPAAPDTTTSQAGGGAGAPQR